MERSIVFSGFGGQGVLTAGLILANAANAAGKQVLWQPAYGGQMRGGKSYSLVKFDDAPICHPDIEALDILVAMNRPSLEAFAPFVKPQGIIIINSDAVSGDELVSQAAARDTSGINADSAICAGSSLTALILARNISIFPAPLASIAAKAENPRGANIAALGLLIRLTGYFEYDFFRLELLKFFEGKGKGGYAEINEAALFAGYSLNL